MSARDLTVFGAVAMMTSREMADLTEKRHDSVKRTIDTLAANGLIAQPQIVDGEKSLNGVVEKLYTVGKRDSYVIVAQLSPEFTARLVDRWQELEAAQAPKLPQTYAQALRLAAEQAETIEAQAAQLEQAKPALAFVDNYVVRSTGSLSFRAVAKLIGAKENAFRDFLKSEKIMYQLGGAWHAYAPHLDAGRFEVRTGTTADGIEKTGRAYTQTMFTPKGVSWIAGEWAKYQISKPGAAA